MNEGAIGASCSEDLGLITQSVLQLDGVENVKVDAKNNDVQVSYDPGKTTPEKIVLAFNKENPETPLQSPSATKIKQVNTSKRHGNGSYRSNQSSMRSRQDGRR